LFLLLSGWIIVLAAAVVLESRAAEPVFALAGVAVQTGGLAMLFRCHAGARKERR